MFYTNMSHKYSEMLEQKQQTCLIDFAEPHPIIQI